MKYINPPMILPKNVTHQTFYSNILDHEVGYNIYLPPSYLESNERYAVVYHIHGWQGNESSDMWSIEQVYQNKQTITVFINAISTKDNYYSALFQIESILINEIIPHIDQQYRTNLICKNRMLSGFSMGGAMAFYYAIKNYNLFGSITSYAGTFHHQLSKDFDGVGENFENATCLYNRLIDEKRYLEKDNILNLVYQNADKIRSNINIDLHIGTKDIVLCENEIMHLFLESLNIPHNYKKYVGIEHELNKLVSFFV